MKQNIKKEKTVIVKDSAKDVFLIKQVKNNSIKEGEIVETSDED